MFNILFVHGIAQQNNDPDELHQIWLNAIADGFRKANLNFPKPMESSFAYYGNLLADFAGLREMKLRDVENSDFPPEFKSFLKSSLEEMVQSQGYSPRSLVEEVSPEFDFGQRSLQNNRFIIDAIRWIDQNFPELSRAGIGLLLRDAYLYIFESEVRKAVNAKVMEKFSGKSTLIVSHSLGTCISYDLLRSGALGNPKNHRLITLGSPLGIKCFIEGLGNAVNPLNQKSWFNAYDKKDIVALNPLKPPIFNVSPDVINFGDVKNKTPNHHGIEYYLSNAKVAEFLDAYLK